MINRISKIGLLVMLILMILPVPPLTSNTVIQIRFSHVVAENTPKGWGAAEFARRVNRELKGKVQVQVYPNGSLYRDNQAIEALAAGDLEMAAPSSAKFMGIVPALQLFDMPFLFSDIRAVHRTMDGEIGHELKGIFLRRNLGIRLLDFWDNAFKQFTCNVHPLESPEDFAGLKFRIMGSDVLERQMNSLGAKGVRLPFGEVYDVLAKGIVDGQENTASNIFTGNFHQVQDYLTFSNHGYLGYVVIVNEPFWAKLPRPVRKRLNAILKDVTLAVRKKALELDVRHSGLIRTYAREHGRPVITDLTSHEKKALQQAMSPVYKEFSGIVPQRWISIIKRL